MRQELAELHGRLKTTMIYVTHDQVEAMTMADKIVVLQVDSSAISWCATGSLSPSAQPLCRWAYRFTGHELFVGGYNRIRHGQRAAARWCQFVSAAG